MLARQGQRNLVSACFMLLYHCCRDDINLVCALKAMGLEADQEVVQLVGGDTSVEALLIPTVQECKALGIFTQAQVCCVHASVRACVRVNACFSDAASVQECYCVLGCCNCIPSVRVGGKRLVFARACQVLQGRSKPACECVPMPAAGSGVFGRQGQIRQQGVP
jgi:hypothetical protein